ncbi:MAG: NAD(P)-binding domain-containing protein [Flavobacteriales bacterium]|nr:NAD(P)-binding domain-containing protein [Flavobacteriales bacterium]
MANKGKIGVIGAGAMGSGIAQIAASAGHEVVLYDNNSDSVELAGNKLVKIFDRLVEKGKKTRVEADEILGRLELTTSLERVDECMLVVEAIIENLDIKKQVFQKLENIVGKECILATNTSSLSVTSIAAACQHKGRVIGLHFFNPAPLMPLVEVIPALTTDELTVQMAKSLMLEWGKAPAIAKDTPGFIVNRVARPFYGEALRILEEGIADVATIDWAMKEIGGFRMGPFELMDFIGHDVNYVVTETVFREFYYDPRYKPSLSQKRLVEAGYLGRKSGRGFYDYSEASEAPVPKMDKAIGGKIVNRILAMLINEAADALFLQVASAEDLDLAMTKGVNYPKGLLQWANDMGLDHVLNILEDLHEEYREDRYRASPILRKMSSKGRLFFEEA